MSRGAPPAGDQPAQLAVAAPVRGEHDQVHAAVEAELGADDQLQRRALRVPTRARRHRRGRERMQNAQQAPVRQGLLQRRMRADHAGDRAFVGDRERRVAEFQRARHQLRRTARRRAGR